MIDNASQYEYIAFKPRLAISLYSKKIPIDLGFERIPEGHKSGLFAKLLFNNTPVRICCVRLDMHHSNMIPVNFVIKM